MCVRLKSDDIREEKAPQGNAATLEALSSIRAAHEHNPQKFSFFDPKSPEHDILRDDTYATHRDEVSAPDRLGPLSTRVVKWVPF